MDKILEILKGILITEYLGTTEYIDWRKSYDSDYFEEFLSLVDLSNYHLYQIDYKKTFNHSFFYLGTDHDHQRLLCLAFWIDDKGKVFNIEVTHK